MLNTLKSFNEWLELMFFTPKDKIPLNKHLFFSYLGYSQELGDMFMLDLICKKLT